MIFSGVVACACDLPSADLEVLSAGITALGGQWRTGLTKDVTHLFALSPSSAKYATAMHFKEETGVRVVLPHWFDDAVRLGMGGLKTRPYEWPDPEILKGVDERSSGGAGKGKGKADIEQDEVKRNMYATAAFFTPTTTTGHHGQSSPPSTLDISTVLNKKNQASPETSQVLQGRKILLSRTLELYKNRHKAVQLGIERAGGVVIRFEGDDDEPEELNDQEKQGGKELSVGERRRRRNEASKVEDCDVLVTRWRFGRAYVNVSFLSFFNGVIFMIAATLGLQVEKGRRHVALVVPRSINGDPFESPGSIVALPRSKASHRQFRKPCMGILSLFFVFFNQCGN